ncbi:hypothetical protein P9436_21385 [Lysinibacillus capsici]|uniref:hypothetical protein n=1 Tax=Lysinibacillus capsici TaxID=2115968 RepID=UPI002E1EE46E|nr:hypothetical protein [Lysinibacillus capsici]
MEEYLKSKQKAIDSIKIDERIKQIATQDSAIREILKPIDEIDNDIVTDLLTFNDSLKSVEYNGIENPNIRVETLLEQQLDVLNDIKQDTSLISSVILLIQKDVTDSSKHLELIKEALEIATATTKEEADSKFGKLLAKINTTVESAQNVQTLVNWAKTIYILYTSSN